MCMSVSFSHMCHMLQCMVVVIGQTGGSISSKTPAYDCLCTLELCSSSSSSSRTDHLALF